MKWRTLPFIFFLCFIVLSTAKAQSPHHFDHPKKLLQEHSPAILLLASDEEALRFHQRFMPLPSPARQDHEKRKRSHPKKKNHVLPQKIQATTTTFWAALTTIGHVQKFRSEFETSFSTSVLKETFPADTQRQWLLSKPSLGPLKGFMEFHDKLSTWTHQEPPTQISPEDGSRLDKLYDQIDTTSSQQTWIDLFNDLGFNGIRTRLEKFWQRQGQQELSSTPPDTSLTQYAIHQYIGTRLIPIFHRHLLTQANTIVAQAYDVAWESWNHIQLWQQEARTYLAKRRLCGTWKWIIHNHQNHGDHKTTMTFSPPEQSTPSQVQPSTILIHGDTVFLKWTFSQGVQEDSLLMSNRDTRLEGTFRNSLGPHGSISGKRLSPCPN